MPAVSSAGPCSLCLSFPVSAASSGPVSWLLPSPAGRVQYRVLGPFTAGTAHLHRCPGEGLFGMSLPLPRQHLFTAHRFTYLTMFIGHDSRRWDRGEDDQIPVLIALMFAGSGLYFYLMSRILISHAQNDEFRVDELKRSLLVQIPIPYNFSVLVISPHPSHSLCLQLFDYCVQLKL